MSILSDSVSVKIWHGNELTVENSNSNTGAAQKMKLKLKFTLQISSVNVTKSAGNRGFCCIYWRNPWWKASFSVQKEGFTWMKCIIFWFWIWVGQLTWLNKFERLVIGNRMKLQETCSQYTAWKVSKCGVISGSSFPIFGLNTEIYRVNSIRIQENTDQK